ncbi:TetR/AcrR family transcriptional regulator [Actinokineospora xionganensis]|uniref:TetR/AcrR family transcriptional regulator n=1 Tax=Actinokineospora xionganensis TaxID=2684470 RepID=A0ABR7LA13_9PSEU|nr:TetR/AcrR family transcriptional regulator [Actinokineospora xionganensis]MBC6449469.1 TetR/AcrR family transcriptional regulator [Actinokineospora xionganensis]
MNAGRTARDRARAEVAQEIKDEARRHLVTEGAHGLSLRAVSRSLGVASSALYRYFPSRDDLLTALIIDAYDAMGAAAEHADSEIRKGRGKSADSTGEAEPRDRWLAVCRAVRTWAVNHRHEYELIYGSPVPGYEAPKDTVAPATRVPLLLTAIATAGKVEDSSIGHGLRSQLSSVIGMNSIDLPPGALARVMVAWTQLFGVISFELFGQLVGSADPADDFFDFSAAAMADFVGL